MRLFSRADQKSAAEPALISARMLAVTPPPFAELFREHAPHAGRALRNLGVSEVDLPDALQEAFLVVHRKLPSFRGESSLRTWIYGICMRVAAAYRRRPQRARETTLDDAPVAVAPTTPHDEAERREALAQLDAALERLDDDKRVVFVLYELEELTLAEVAAAVGAPLPTVFSRLQAARRIIQSAFAEDGAGQRGQKR